ncbi:hypothetical protein F7725_018707 [Dissostichus mawsoni]|uniref:Uncharacterized protein n=1 Tax=Dissostichus mawsoni TaxID=36200 RepID=A0A7J5XSC0_DISMA|nr:hypothetical protein F7725_018707 [Dissostichus mawsoni]
MSSDDGVRLLFLDFGGKEGAIIYYVVNSVIFRFSSSSWISTHVRSRWSSSSTPSSLLRSPAWVWWPDPSEGTSPWKTEIYLVSPPLCSLHAVDHHIKLLQSGTQAE